MKFYRLLIILVGILFSFVFSEEGCVDLYAENYNPDADINDGSCVYSDNGNFYLSFDNVDDWVEVENSPTLNMTEEITIASWVRLDPEQNDRYMIVEKADQEAGWFFAVDDGDGLNHELIFVISNVGASRSTVSFPDGEFVHAVGTYSTENGINIYINGVNYSTAYHTWHDSLITNTDVSLSINQCRWCTPDGFTNKLINDLKIWDVELSEEEVHSEFLGENELYSASLKANWKFNEGEGNTIFDHSGNQNHGAAYGEPSWRSFGCMDSNACNFNENASQEDGSCVYADGICETCSGETDGTGVVLDNDLNDNGICDNLENTPPESFQYSISTSLAYYYIVETSLDDNDLDASDWIGAFNGDICVGSRQWDISSCSNGVCDIPLYGDDGTDNTAGYMLNGDTPTFKVYDSSMEEYYDINDISDITTWQENIPVIVEYANVIRDCSDTLGGFAPDEDGDGVCDDDEVIGCQDDTACNYYEFATDAGDCTYTDGICETCSGETDGTGIIIDNDEDNDLVCDAFDICPGYNDNIDTDLDSIPNGCDSCPLDPDNDIDEDGLCCNDLDIDNYSLDFDGVDDHVSLPNIGYHGDYTVSLWIKGDVVNVEENIFSSYENSRHLIRLQNGELYGLDLESCESDISNINLKDGEWHHIIKGRSGSIEVN